MYLPCFNLELWFPWICILECVEGQWGEIESTNKCKTHWMVINAIGKRNKRSKRQRECTVWRSDSIKWSGQRELFEKVKQRVVGEGTNHRDICGKNSRQREQWLQILRQEQSGYVKELQKGQFRSSKVF